MCKTVMTIRKAVPEDALRIAEIYNQAVLGKCTCDSIPLTVEEKAEWLRPHIGSDRYPVYVSLIDGYVMGYGYLSEYRFGRPAVAGTAEVSYYLDFDFLGKGHGTEFLDYLIEEARKIGFTSLVAILMGSNDASIALLKKFGFELWGSMPDTVVIGDLVTDHVYYGLKI